MKPNLQKIARRHDPVDRIIQRLSVAVPSLGSRSAGHEDFFAIPETQRLAP